MGGGAFVAFAGTGGGGALTPISRGGVVVGGGGTDGGSRVGAAATAAAGGGGGPGPPQPPAGVGALAPLVAPPCTVDAVDAPPLSPPSILGADDWFSFALGACSGAGL